MAPTKPGMSTEIEELKQYQKRAKYMLAKLHREMDEKDAVIERLHRKVEELERQNRELRSSR